MSAPASASKRARKRKLSTPSAAGDGDDRFQVADDSRFSTNDGDGRFQMGGDPRFDTADTTGDDVLEDDVLEDDVLEGGVEDGTSSNEGDKAAEDTTSAASAKVKGKKEKKPKKKGVIYLSTLPPFMRHEKVRHLLGQFGTITKMYLVPEDKFAHGKRTKAGGNRKTKYVEGWVEFDSKRVAENVATSLNQARVGSKKRDHFYDDVWNIKFLKHFKWQHLTEKLAYEKRIRGKKLQAEIAQSKRENDVYLEKVVQAKKIDAIHSRKKQRRETDAAGSAPGTASQQGKSAAPSASGGGDGHVVVRRFRQRQPIGKTSSGARTPKNVDTSLLAMIVGSKKK
jgi:ESF2/ABP1 family protein